MNMTEATKRLTTVARAYHAGVLEHGETGEVIVTDQTMEAVTVAAAVLGLLVEALEATDTGHECDSPWMHE